MGFKCGIVGLPNVGKSTLFNALTNVGVDVENYPFCTIDPNVGVVPVPDSRLTPLANIVKPQQVVPSAMEFVDIAGLVEGASQGKGLGNQFLAHIRETQAIAQVVRCFEDDDIMHVAEKIDPLADIETINTELCLADYETLENAYQKILRLSKSGSKDAKHYQATLEKVIAHIDSGKAIRFLSLSEEEKGAIAPLHLLTVKPIMYIANINEEGIGDNNNQYLQAIQEFARSENAEMLPVCATIEAEITQLDAPSRLEFLQELGLYESGLDRIIKKGYQLLQLHNYFTAGKKEVRAWTLRKGSTAPQAAGVIHTDFEKGFIRAEVIPYQDFIEHQGEQGAKDAGKWRLEGRDYVVNNGDVMHFRFNV